VGGANSLAISPDGKTLAVAGYSGDLGKVELWDLATKKIRATLVGQPGNQAAYASSVAFSRDGKRLAMAGGTSGDVGTQGAPAWLKLLDLETKQDREIDHGHTALIKSVAFSPDGKTFATGS
jgi:WD40 repeat protein